MSTFSLIYEVVRQIPPGKVAINTVLQAMELFIRFQFRVILDRQL